MPPSFRSLMASECFPSTDICVYVGYYNLNQSEAFPGLNREIGKFHTHDFSPHIPLSLTAGGPAVASPSQLCTPASHERVCARPPTRVGKFGFLPSSTAGWEQGAAFGSPPFSPQVFLSCAQIYSVCVCVCVCVCASLLIWPYKSSLSHYLSLCRSVSHSFPSIKGHLGSQTSPW